MIYKRTIITSFIFIALILQFCTDRVKIEKEDLNKYQYLEVFLPSLKNFIGTFDLDNNEIELIYSTELEIEDYFKSIEKTAQINNWNLIFSREDKRVFTQERIVYGTTNDIVIVEIYHIDSEKFILRVR